MSILIAMSGLIGVYLYRMWRFGLHFAREVLFCFLGARNDSSVARVTEKSSQEVKEAAS